LAYLLAPAFAAASVCVDAAEFVVVTRDHCYPVPGANYEAATKLAIAKSDGMTVQQISAVDAYFDSVRRILDEAPVPSSCCAPAIDSPFVEIDISLDGKAYKLTMTDKGTAGLELSMDPDMGQRRVERILRLSEEWKSRSPH